MSKFAVISQLNESETSGWFVNEDKPVFQISFYSKLDTGLLENCINVPRGLYMGITKGMYDFNSPKSVEFGVVKSSGNLGSYSEIFYADKEDKIVQLLKENKFKIVRK